MKHFGVEFRKLRVLEWILFFSFSIISINTCGTKIWNYSILESAAGDAISAEGDSFFVTASDFEGPNVLSPTIYDLPLSSNYGPCSVSEKISVRDTHGQRITMVCPDFFHALRLEGTGLVDDQGAPLLINVVQHSFTVVNAQRCPYGLGVRNLCLNPFYTIAADLSIYRVGNVIYVPEVAAAKIQLPGGEIHPGYFLVADSGGGIIGENRFDFYTGPYRAFSPSNPFNILGLADKNDHKLYYLVSGETAKNFRAKITQTNMGVSR